MKILVLAFVTACSSAAFATGVNLACNRVTEGNLLEEKTLDIKVSASKIELKVDFFGKTSVVSGDFLKIAKNDSLVYDGGDLTDLVDQADIGFIFVDPKLLKGKKGQIGFSVRQLGDSEGFAWINDRFECEPAR